MLHDPFRRAHALAEARHHRRLAESHDIFARDVIALVGEDEVEVPELKGNVQRRVIGVPEMFTEAGMSASEVAEALKYNEANAYTVLNSLTEAGVTEQIPGASPRRWRMAIQHRRNRILRMSRLVPKGHWTTYGEFSIAVYDNWRMAITIGSVAAKNPAFVNPHRVIWSGGVIKENWSDGNGKGPEECERRLREEGVRFIDGHADHEQFIGWERLRELLQADEAADNLDETA